MARGRGGSLAASAARAGARRAPARRTDRWRALRPRRSSAPRWPRRGSAARSTWSAASSRQRRDARPPSSATTSARGRWSRVRADADRRSTTPTAVAHRGRLYVHGGYAGRGAAEPTARAARATTRHATAGGGCRSRRRRARRTRAAVIGDRLYVAGGANDAGSLRSLEIYDFARRRWRGGPSFPGPARNHTTGVATRRALLRAGRARRAQNFTVGRALRPAPAALGAAAATCARARGGHRLGAAARRPHRRVRRRGPGAGRHHDRDGRAVRPAHAAAGARCRDMRTPRHGLGGAALGDRVYAIEGGPEPGLPLLARDRVPRRARADASRPVSRSRTTSPRAASRS